MLVLTRRVGESIRISNDISIKLIRIKGTQVHLGIEAPTDIPVYREEIFIDIQCNLDRLNGSGSKAVADQGD